MTCAYCQSDRVVRSHRSGIAEQLMSLLLIYPYRCRACEKRIYMQSRSKTAEVTKSWEKVRTQLMVYGLGLLTCLVLVYFLIQERAPAGE